MSKLDRSKEQIAYLKLWLGVLIITAVSLMGWLITHFDTENHFLIFSAVTALVSIFVGCWVLHNKIEHKITQLEDM